MTKTANDMTSLLALAFEIEGLLMLAERRDEMTPAEVLDLLSDKCAALLDGVNRLKPSDTKKIEPEPASTAHVSPEAAEIAAAATFEETEDAEPAGKTVKIEKPEPASPTPQAKPEVQHNISPAPAAPAVVTPAAKSSRPIALTLNDRFRFRRTLFGGSDAQMNETLAILADLPDAADRDDFLVNDLCWNPEDPEVVDFIAIIDARR